MRRLAALSTCLAALALAFAAPAGAQDARVIGPAVTAAGVDLSNITIDQATAKLASTFDPAFARDVVVTAAKRTSRLRAADAKFSFDALRTAKRAYYAAANRPAGDATPLTVVLAVSHSRLAVKTFAEKVARGATTPARNASLRITLRHLYPRHARLGRTIDVAAVRKAIDAALDDPAAVRELAPGEIPLRPRINYRDLLRIYGTVVTIDRAHFTLRLFKQLKIAARYPIAVGMAGLETPSGLYAIHNKQVNPAWHVPTSSWAGSLAGTTIPAGSPSNPIRARWLGIANGVGIHGTSEDWSIGRSASHGCIRMHVYDVVKLYPRVPVGTPVLIK